MRRRITLALLPLFLAACTCTYLGKQGATWQQQFYEADQMAIGAVESANEVILRLRSQDIELPVKLRTALKTQVLSMKMSRTQLRLWVDECGDGACPTERRIELGIDNLKAAAKLVMVLVAEANTHG